jgi:hypothetical protein
LLGSGGAGRRELVGRGAGDDPQSGHPGCRRPLAVWRSIIEWDEVRHGSPQLVLGPDPLV